MMKVPRVKRSVWPRAKKLTEGTYRKKALPLLLKDFQGCCAYCLDPEDFRLPSHSHVDHFNPRLTGRKRNQYVNLMLACVACNYCKLDKPVTNPLKPSQRLLNCTEESEFPAHLSENDGGEWRPHSDAGYYHVESIGLNAACHKLKRAERAKIAKQIRELATCAVIYKGSNPVATHRETLKTIRMLVGHLEYFPALVTNGEVISVRDWLRQQGVPAEFIEPLPAG